MGLEPEMPRGLLISGQAEKLQIDLPVSGDFRINILYFQSSFLVATFAICAFVVKT